MGHSDYCSMERCVNQVLACLACRSLPCQRACFVREEYGSRCTFLVVGASERALLSQAAAALGDLLCSDPTIAIQRGWNQDENPSGYVLQEAPYAQGATPPHAR